MRVRLQREPFCPLFESVAASARATVFRRLPFASFLDGFAGLFGRGNVRLSPFFLVLLFLVGFCQRGSPEHAAVKITACFFFRCSGEVLS